MEDLKKLIETEKLLSYSANQMIAARNAHSTKMSIQLTETLTPQGNASQKNTGAKK